MFADLWADLCVCVCVRVCVCVCVKWIKSKSWCSRSNIFKTQYLYSRYRRNPRHHFLCRAGSLTGNSQIVSCKEESSGARDEGIYEWVRVRTRILCCQLQTPCFSENTSTKKIIQNTWKCCLQHATNVKFSNFCDWRFSRFFSPHPTKKNALSFPEFGRKPGWCMLPHSVAQQTHVCFMTFTFSQPKVIDLSFLSTWRT